MEMKITNDNPDIADLSEANHPTKLAEMFSELHDSKWTDAFELLTQKKTEIEAIKCLLEILIRAHLHCKTLREKNMEELKKTLLVHEGDTIPDFVPKYIKENGKKGADSLLETETKGYKDRVFQSTLEWRDIAPPVSAYIQECFRFCYLMSIQDPPVVFDTLDITQGDPLDTKKYKLYTKSGVIVDFMVWPCLVLCKDGRVLSKGIVQCFSSQIKSDRVRSAPLAEGRQRPIDAEFLYQPATSGKESTCVDFDNQLESVENNETCDQVAGTKDKSFIRDGTDGNKRIKWLSPRVSAKMIDNNPDVVNLGDTNRPDKLRDKYSELYDNEWTDAYGDLEEDGVSTEKAIDDLLNILMTSYKVSQDKAKFQLDSLSCFGGMEKLPVEIAKGLKENRKLDFNYMKQVPEVEKMVIKQLDFKGDIKKSLGKYLHECVSLTWLMAIQDPPMVLDDPSQVDGKPFNKKIYREYMTAGAQVKFVVWPAMFMNEGGSLAKKGVAECYDFKGIS